MSRVQIHDHRNIHQGGRLPSGSSTTPPLSPGSGSGVPSAPGVGSSVADILDLPTAETTTTKVLAPDGAGGVEFRAEAGGTGASLPWYDVTTYGATGDGATDDTTAVQDAIDACMTAGGGTVYFPPGDYLIGGALQDTGTYNSQLVIPQNAFGGEPVAIRFLGWAPNTTYGGTPTSGSIIRSDWNGTISGHPAIISAGTWHGIAESTLYATFEDVVIVAPDDPKLSGLQMTACLGVRIQDVQIRTTSAVPSTAPTHSNAAGYEGPWGLASQVPDYAIGLDVYGFYTGIVPAEQMHGVDVGVAFCTQAMLFVGGPTSPTFTHYPVTFTKLVFTLCIRGLVFTTDVRWVQISSMSVEHDASPFAAVYDIDDASNLAYGFIDYQVIDFTNGVGSAYPLRLNGGSNLSFHQASEKWWKLNSQVEIPTGTDPSTNPATGGKLYAASATGHPTWRDSAGTVSDLLAGGGPSPAATVTDETSFGLTPAVGTDTEYARQDHTHGTPDAPTGGGGGGQILIADVHSTPLVFGDLLQTDAGDDLLYADA